MKKGSPNLVTLSLEYKNNDDKYYIPNLSLIAGFDEKFVDEEVAQN